jgi:hypothetical protein
MAQQSPGAVPMNFMLFFIYSLKQALRDVNPNLAIDIFPSTILCMQPQPFRLDHLGTGKYRVVIKNQNNYRTTLYIGKESQWTKDPWKKCGQKQRRYSGSQ